MTQVHADFTAVGLQRLTVDVSQLLFSGNRKVRLMIEIQKRNKITRSGIVQPDRDQQLEPAGMEV